MKVIKEVLEIIIIVAIIWGSFAYSDYKQSRLDNANYNLYIQSC